MSVHGHPGGPPPEEMELLSTPAGPAGVAADSPVGRLAATVDRLSREVRAAQAEAEGRALIELAKGLLVERLGCGPAQGARQLAELTLAVDHRALDGADGGRFMTTLEQILADPEVLA